MIEIQDLHITLGETPVFSNLNLHIKKGEFVTILGPSGCGKSTLFNCIAGFISPDRGGITIHHNDPECPKARVGVIFQEYAVFPWRTVLKNLMLGFHGQQMTRQEKIEKARELINLVGLNGQENSFPKVLSGGMKQRVAIARALAMDAPVILMDEPFGALDNFMRERLQDLVSSIWLKLNKTILFVTHNIREAAFLGNRVLLMNKSGQIVFDQETPVLSNRTDDQLFKLEKEIRPFLTYDFD